MLVVAVISRKSGVGKSTVAVHLAVEAAKAGPVAVVDLDVQASAAGWGDSRTAERPGILDLRAIGQSTEIAQLAGKPAAVVITAAPAVGNQASEAAERSVRPMAWRYVRSWSASGSPSRAPW